MQGWNGYVRAGGIHLLSIDADEDLDATRVQGVTRPPAAGFSSYEANLAALGELTVSRVGRVGVGTGQGRREGPSGRRSSPDRPTATNGRSAPAVRGPIRASRVFIDELALLLQDFGLGQHHSNYARAACTARHEQNEESASSVSGVSRLEEWDKSK